MSPRTLLSSTVFASVFLLAAAACSSSDEMSNESSFVEPSATPPPMTSTSAEPFDDRIDRTLAAAPVAGAVCAAVSAEARLAPVALVVAFDRSGSMGDTQESASFDPKLRWIPVGQAMKAFFADRESALLHASLTFFPTPASSCLSADYDEPNVPLTALPSAAFATAIDRTAPRGDTPTRAAMLGAIVQAKAIAAAHPDMKAVIVLVTDGEPFGCGIDTTAESNAEALGVANEVKKANVSTYVVGVGPSVANVDAIANAGGTDAFHVQVGNAAKTSADLLATLTKIRGEVAPCDVAIPAPPDGRSLDWEKVHVEALGATQPYVADCAGGAGWHYDDARAPTKVSLCPATCAAVKAQTSAKIDVWFRCENRPDALH